MREWDPSRINNFYSDRSHKNPSEVGSWKRERRKMKFARGRGFSKDAFFQQVVFEESASYGSEKPSGGRGCQEASNPVCLYPPGSLLNLLSCWTLAPPQGQILLLFPETPQHAKCAWACVRVGRKSSDNP